MKTPRHTPKGPTPTAATVLAAAALLGLGGCGLLDSSSSRRDDDVSRRRTEPRSEPRYEDRTRDRYDDRPVDRTRDRVGDSRTTPAGPGDTWYDDTRYDREDAAYERDTRTRDQRPDANVPRGAREAAVGKGVVSYRATQDGRAWVAESEFDKVIWSGKVYDGEVIEVVPKRDRVFVDRREVLKADLNPDIRYRVYFDRDRN